MTNAEARRMFLLAGVTEDEMSEHPEYGLMVTEAGLRKLAKAAPDQDRAKRFMDWVDAEVLPAIRASK